MQKLSAKQVRKIFTKIGLLGGSKMSNNRNMMSNKLKEEIAKELGVYNQVKQDGGWGNVSSKTCGNMVTKAIEIANRTAENH